jgi:hypothetical protein
MTLERFQAARHGSSQFLASSRLSLPSDELLSQTERVDLNQKFARPDSNLRHWAALKNGLR